MRRLLFLLLLLFSTSLLAKNVGDTIITIITPLQISRMLDDKHNTIALPDLIDKEEKIDECIQNYIRRQSKSYSKIVQQNLYGLMNDFDSIAAKIYGKKVLPDDISYDDKIELLARVQCEAYYKMGILGKN